MSDTMLQDFNDFVPNPCDEKLKIEVLTKLSLEFIMVGPNPEFSIKQDWGALAFLLPGRTVSHYLLPGIIITIGLPGQIPTICETEGPKSTGEGIMALQNLHEMIHNLSSYIKSLEVLCESGVRLAKNFERLLSPGPMLFSGVVSSSGSAHAQHLDSDVLTQSVATWELAQKIATADATALISELLPLLQETVQSVMKDPTSFHSTNTYEYLQCTSSSQGAYPQQAGPAHGPSYFPRTPDSHLAHSPTTGSFSSSSGDRRESTESCMSSFSMPRSSISSGLSALSSRSTSPSSQAHHSHYYGAGHNTRSRNSSPSVKFTPSQPPSPLMPYGDGGYPYLFRRWSTQTHNCGGNASSASTASGPNTSSAGSSAFSSYGSSGSNPGFNTMGFSRRWSVPASAGHNQAGSSSGDSNRRNDSESYDYGLLDAINLLSVKPPSPSTVKIDESDHEFDTEQTTSLWPPSEKMPGVVLTTCGSDAEAPLTLENLQRASHQSLHVRFGSAETTTVNQPVTTTNVSAIPSAHNQYELIEIQAQPGEYSLFGNPPSSASQGQGP